MYPALFVSLDTVPQPHHLPTGAPAPGAFVAWPVATGVPMAGTVADLYRLAYEKAAQQAVHARFRTLTWISPN